MSKYKMPGISKFAKDGYVCKLNGRNIDRTIKHGNRETKIKGKYIGTIEKGGGHDRIFILCDKTLSMPFKKLSTCKWKGFQKVTLVHNNTTFCSDDQFILDVIKDVMFTYNMAFEIKYRTSAGYVFYSDEQKVIERISSVL